MRRVIVSLFIVLAGFQSSFSQGENRLKVFMDCANTQCFEDYMRTEINIVDFFLDQNLADVHVLITDNRNASQGRTYQMIFFGQNQFSNYQDTLTFATPPLATDFQRREVMAKYLQLGLSPFVAKTGSADLVTIQMKSDLMKSEDTQEVDIPDDKWNYWVYRVGAEGSLEVDQNSSSLDAEFTASANQIKPNSRVSFRSNYQQNFNVFLDPSSRDNEEVINNHEFNFRHLYVHGLNSQWSLGYFANFENNTFSNIKSSFELSPALEYSFFPYEDFNNRFVTLRYSVGVNNTTFYDSTIYNQIQQWLPQHRLRLSADFNQRWGNIRSGLTLFQYLHDPEFYSISLFGDLEVRLSGALSINLFVFGRVIKDQINLAKGEASVDDLLTRRRELQSNFRLNSRVGISYRFGSQLNNFVNPRFD